MSLVAKIEDIESEIARTQINKQTMAHLCSLRAKLAKYKRELVADPKGGGGGPGEGFDVRATGDARVGFVGFPSVGKSTLLTSLTDVASEAASYEFTTLTCIPGIKYWKGAKIQLLDLPGIIEGARDGKGRGRQVIAVARTCSCLIIVLDAMKDIAQKKIIERELEGVGIRLNKQPPDIRVEKKVSGGINFAATCKLTHLDEDSIKAPRPGPRLTTHGRRRLASPTHPRHVRDTSGPRAAQAILTEYRIMSATVRINCDATPDDLIDAIEGNRVYMPCVYALNKIDAITMEERRARPAGRPSPPSSPHPLSARPLPVRQELDILINI